MFLSHLAERESGDEVASTSPLELINKVDGRAGLSNRLAYPQGSTGKQDEKKCQERQCDVVHVVPRHGQSGGSQLAGRFRRQHGPRRTETDRDGLTD